MSTAALRTIGIQAVAGSFVILGVLMAASQGIDIPGSHQHFLVWLSDPMMPAIFMAGVGVALSTEDFFVTAVPPVLAGLTTDVFSPSLSRVADNLNIVISSYSEYIGDKSASWHFLGNVASKITLFTTSHSILFVMIVWSMTFLGLFVLCAVGLRMFTHRNVVQKHS